MPTTNNPNSNPYNTSNIGTTYKKPNTTTQSTTLVSQNNNPAQKQGIGTMGKVVIGAGVAAAGYGAYRALKARKEAKERQEERNKQL